ncbi:hypothetical protein H2203_000517 [Taxawa tesnikishii (nom. ined.)]|nr:hypothetical protein H2203_000517 [Dothideales sp. JES 119]
MASNLLSLGGWYFLPNLVTGWAQSIYYAVWIRAGDPRPQPGTPLYAKHRRRIHVLVILTYLLYTIYEADWELRRAGDFYQDLGVAHDASERTIQSRFRRLTVQYHPDKISSSTDRAAAERFYVHLQLARDTLVDPIKRFSYDRFGPSMLAWRHRHTIWDHVSVGVQQIAGYYIGTAAVLVLFGITGYAQHAPFWRYLAMVSLLVFELYTMTRPDSPIVLTRVVNPLITRLGLRSPYLPFQFLSLARKIVLTVFIAISQIGPLLAQARGPGAAGDASGTVQGQQLDFWISSAWCWTRKARSWWNWSWYRLRVMRKRCGT